jgi:hypothetical protein
VLSPGDLLVSLFPRKYECLIRETVSTAIEEPPHRFLEWDRDTSGRLPSINDIIYDPVGLDWVIDCPPGQPGDNCSAARDAEQATSWGLL